MATSFTKLLVHFVFSTKNREPLIAPEIEIDLHAYIVGITRQFDCWTIAINSTEDHIHLLINMSKKTTVIELMENVKGSSSAW